MPMAFPSGQLAGPQLPVPTRDEARAAAEEAAPRADLDAAFAMWLQR